VDDKYPNYVFMSDKLTEVDGLSCWIIYRDCRDVTSSILKRVRNDWRNRSWANGINTVEKVATQWVRAIELMERCSDCILNFILTLDSNQKTREVIYE
jgi:hypothetical protein